VRHRLAFIEDSAPQKMTAKIIKQEFFAALASTNAGRKTTKRRKKMNFPLR